MSWDCYGFHGPIDTYEGAWNRLHCDSCSPEAKKSAEESLERLRKKREQVDVQEKFV